MEKSMSEGEPKDPEVVVESIEAGAEAQESAEVVQARQAVESWKSVLNSEGYKKFTDLIRSPDRQVQDALGTDRESLLTAMARFAHDPLERDNPAYYTPELMKANQAGRIADRLPEIEEAIASVKRIGEARRPETAAVEEAGPFIERQVQHYMKTLGQRVERFIDEVVQHQSFQTRQQHDDFRAFLTETYASDEFQKKLTERLTGSAVMRSFLPAKALNDFAGIKSLFADVKYPGAKMAPDSVPDYLTKPLKFDYFASPQEKVG
jgi:hypothetical protein